MLCGLVTAKAAQLLLPGKNAPALKSNIPLTKTLLVVATVSNILGAFALAWVILYLVIETSHVKDAARFGQTTFSLAYGFTAGSCQIFMATRCWRILDRSMPAAIGFGVLILATFAAVVYATTTFSTSNRVNT